MHRRRTQQSAIADVEQTVVELSSTSLMRPWLVEFVNSKTFQGSHGGAFDCVGISAAIIASMPVRSCLNAGQNARLLWSDLSGKVSVGIYELHRDFPSELAQESGGIA